MSVLLKITCSVVCALLLAISTGCADFTEALETQQATNIQAGAVIKDANGQNLGKAIFISVSGITIESKEGYVYYIQWDGSFTASTIYYETDDCTGVAYAYGQADSVSSNKKYTFYHSGEDAFYIVDTEQVPIEDFAYMSYDTGDGCTMVSSTHPFGLFVEEVTKSTIGIPDSIEPPFTLEDP